MMNCTRCQGTMVIDYFLDMEESGEIWMPGWRCLMCGEVIDPLILKHRQAQRAHGELVEAISSPPSNKTPSPVAVLSRK
ncbi:MAG: hypothetical protein MRJ96_03525 [Nitrospirales bacterium]|nr:hypothetical protein [Nitrospira sp.]MDR4500508.1 hypothetical protein [Nitrospirales bacterium]